MEYRNIYKKIILAIFLVIIANCGGGTKKNIKQGDILLKTDNPEFFNKNNITDDSITISGIDTDINTGSKIIHFKQSNSENTRSLTIANEEFKGLIEDKKNDNKHDDNSNNTKNIKSQRDIVHQEFLDSLKDNKLKEERQQVINKKLEDEYTKIKDITSLAPIKSFGHDNVIIEACSETTDHFIHNAVYLFNEIASLAESEIQYYQREIDVISKELIKNYNEKIEGFKKQIISWSETEFRKNRIYLLQKFIKDYNENINNLKQETKKLGPNIKILTEHKSLYRSINKIVHLLFRVSQVGFTTKNDISPDEALSLLKYSLPDLKSTEIIAALKIIKYLKTNSYTMSYDQEVALIKLFKTKGLLNEKIYSQKSNDRTTINPKKNFKKRFKILKNLKYDFNKIVNDLRKNVFNSPSLNHIDNINEEDQKYDTNEYEITNPRYKELISFSHNLINSKVIKEKHDFNGKKIQNILLVKYLIDTLGKEFVKNHEILTLFEKTKEDQSVKVDKEVKPIISARYKFLKNHLEKIKKTDLEDLLYSYQSIKVKSVPELSQNFILGDPSFPTCTETTLLNILTVVFPNDIGMKLYSKMLQQTDFGKEILRFIKESDKYKNPNELTIAWTDLLYKNAKKNNISFDFNKEGYDIVGKTENLKVLNHLFGKESNKNKTTLNEDFFTKEKDENGEKAGKLKYYYNGIISTFYLQEAEHHQEVSDYKLTVIPPFSSEIDIIDKKYEDSISFDNFISNITQICSKPKSIIIAETESNLLNKYNLFFMMYGSGKCNFDRFHRMDFRKDYMNFLIPIFLKYLIEQDNKDNMTHNVQNRRPYKRLSESIPTNRSNLEKNISKILYFYRPLLNGLSPTVISEAGDKLDKVDSSEEYAQKIYDHILNTDTSNAFS